MSAYGTSAYGTKRTSRPRWVMSAVWGRAEASETQGPNQWTQCLRCGKSHIAKPVGAVWFSYAQTKDVRYDRHHLQHRHRQFIPLRAPVQHFRNPGQLSSRLDRHRYLIRTRSRRLKQKHLRRVKPPTCFPSKNWAPLSPAEKRPSRQIW